VTGRRGIRRKQLRDELKEKGRYRKLKGEALTRPMWGTRFGRGSGPFERQTAVWLSPQEPTTGFSLKKMNQIQLIFE
jgi:hypothetical protein